MQIIEKAIGDLRPYEQNPRKNAEAVKYVANSIKEFGFKVPVVIDKNNVIVAGHTRLLAAKKLKMKTVPCVIADDLTDEQVKAFRLADNKTAEFAAWDNDLLALELVDLSLDMTQFGFGNLELPKEIVEDEAPAVEETTTTKRGDIFILGEHRLMCGDSTDGGDVAMLLDGDKPALMLTDPPYGIDVVLSSGRLGSKNIANCTPYKHVEADKDTNAAEKAYKLAKEFCQRMVIFGGNYFTKFLDFSDGWLIWDKKDGTGRNKFADGEMAWCSFHTAVRIYKQVWNGMIREGEREKRLHPTQKPIRLLAEILKDFSSDGDIIMDLFGGSGSTLIACEQTGRKCRMIEIDPAYCDVIIKRWELYTGEKAKRVDAA